MDSLGTARAGVRDSVLRTVRKHMMRDAALAWGTFFFTRVW